LYDITTNKVRRLTSDGQARLDYQPEFRDGGHVTYISSRTATDSSLRTFDLSSGKWTRIVTQANGVAAFDWSPDRVDLGYLSSGTPGRDSVSVWNARSDTVRTVWRGPPPGPGRDGFKTDDLSVTWSPDGRAILIVDTALWPGSSSAPSNTIYVVRPDGTTVTPPWLGTFGRWSADGRTILYQQFGSAATRWFSRNLATGKEMRLNIRPGTQHPALSLDGRFLAYDDGKVDPSVFVYDLSTGVERRVVTGYVEPVWISVTTLVATATTPCTDDCTNPEPPWRSRGWASRISITTRAASRLRIAETGDAGILCDRACFGP
jgi:Tol biopolymer transport system component